MDNKALNKKLIRTENIRGEEVKIFGVKGTEVRDSLDIDFTAGGHKHVSERYSYIPDSEIWVDSDMNEKDFEATILHEVTEYEKMKYDHWDYDKAHDYSSKVELEFRNGKEGENKEEPLTLEEFTKRMPDIESPYAGENGIIYKARIYKYTNQFQYFKSGRRQGKPVSIPYAYTNSYLYFYNKNKPISKQAQEIIKPEWDKMKEFILETEVNNADSFSLGIKELYNKKLTPSSLERVKSVLETKNTKNPTFISESDKDVLYNWEGFGGKYNSEESKTGGLHEFFTPYFLCKAIAEIMINLGAKTDKVLDPATGTGRLLRYLNAKEIHAFEVNKLNADITQKLYSQSKVYNQAFETAFLKAPRFNSMAKTSWLGNDFDLVVSNPPYGEYTGEYKSFMPRVFTRFEFLFVALSMSLVKSGGYGIFVLPQSFMNNGNMYNKMKEEIMKYNTFVDAVRLPNGIFASTDIGVDLLVLKRK